MTLRFWRSWGIAARLLAIAVLPASIMFLAVMASLYVSALGDVRRDVATRGQLVATALSESSQYGLVSGNHVYLRTTLRHLLEADPSIACIDITDEAHRVVVKDCQDITSGEQVSFEVPIRLESLPDLDQFDSGAPPTTAHQAASLRTVGHVRVMMSPAPIFQAKHRTLMVASVVVLAAAVLSCLVGLWLARRLRHTMVSVMSALRAIRQGRFDVQLGTPHEGELGELQKTIVQMAATLDAGRHELEQQVASRTRELQDAVVLARQADAEKRRLIVHSNALVEEERRRIALDIHDHLGSALISVRLEASALTAYAKAHNDAEMERDTRRIAATVESVYAMTRDIVQRLRPELIDTLGLAGAVEELVRLADRRHPDCRFSYRAETALPDLRSELAMPVYRVTQEALTNIVKHAQATEVSVSLGVEAGGHRLHVVIKDNGRGFDARDRGQAGIGLIGMRERVASAGGELVITSAPGLGTTVRVSLPLTPEGTSS